MYTVVHSYLTSSARRASLPPSAEQTAVISLMTWKVLTRARLETCQSPFDTSKVLINFVRAVKRSGGEKIWLKSAGIHHHSREVSLVY